MIETRMKERAVSPWGREWFSRLLSSAKVFAGLNSTKSLQSKPVWFDNIRSRRGANPT
jgi:hypothetical protein